MCFFNSQYFALPPWLALSYANGLQKWLPAISIKFYVAWKTVLFHFCIYMVSHNYCQSAIVIQMYWSGKNYLSVCVFVVCLWLQVLVRALCITFFVLHRYSVICTLKICRITTVWNYDRPTDRPSDRPTNNQSISRRKCQTQGSSNTSDKRKCSDRNMTQSNFPPFQKIMTERWTWGIIG